MEIYFSALFVSAACVAFATAIIIFRNGLGREFFVGILNVASDTAYCALGFYIG